MGEKETMAGEAAPRDVATGQSSGREAGSGMASGRESPTRASDGKTMATDDWHESGRESPTRASDGKTMATDDWHQSGRVATGDVDGDGAAELKSGTLNVSASPGGTAAAELNGLPPGQPVIRGGG